MAIVQAVGRNCDTSSCAASSGRTSGTSRGPSSRQGVREWKIPSLELELQRGGGGGYVRKMPVWRRVRAYWAVHGPEALFLFLVLSMQVAFGVWQLVKYTVGGCYIAAFGWGVVLAKTTAGTLYPTMFFLVLSMSRYYSTFLRWSYYLSRFINWETSRNYSI